MNEERELKLIVGDFGRMNKLRRRIKKGIKNQVKTYGPSAKALNDFVKKHPEDVIAAVMVCTTVGIFGVGFGFLLHQKLELDFSRKLIEKLKIAAELGYVIDYDDNHFQIYPPRT